MPFDKSRYPSNWREISQRIRERDGNKCKRCGVVNGAVGYRDHAGRFWSDEEIERLDDNHEEGPWRRVKIVLTVAHVNDPDPMNCADDNLEALCQQCHNRLDAPMRARNAAATKRRKRIEASGQAELF